MLNLLLAVNLTDPLPAVDFFVVGPIPLPSWFAVDAMCPVRIS